MGVDVGVFVIGGFVGVGVFVGVGGFVGPGAVFIVITTFPSGILNVFCPAFKVRLTPVTEDCADKR